MNVNDKKILEEAVAGILNNTQFNRTVKNNNTQYLRKLAALRKVVLVNLLLIKDKIKEKYRPEESGEINWGLVGDLEAVRKTTEDVLKFLNVKD